MEKSVYRSWIQMLSWKLSCPHWGPQGSLLYPTRHMLISIFHEALYEPMLPNICKWETTVNCIRNQQTVIQQMRLYIKMTLYAILLLEYYRHKLKTTLKFHNVIVLLNKKIPSCCKIHRNLCNISMNMYIARNNELMTWRLQFKQLPQPTWLPTAITDTKSYRTTQTAY